MPTLIPPTIIEVLKKYAGVAPTPIIKLATDLGIKVYETGDYTDHQSGQISFEDGKFVIYVNTKHPATRKRFTLAHEIAHFALHQDEIKRGSHVDGVRQPVHALQRANGRESMTADEFKMETDANALAAEILMPEETFKAKWALTSSIEEVAEYFGVSTSAAAVRGKVLMGEIMM